MHIHAIHVMHLPELAAVGTLGFARRVKGRRGSNSTADSEEQTQIWPGTIMVQAGRPQLGSRSGMDQVDMSKLEFRVGPVQPSHSADADQRLDHWHSGPAGTCQTQPRKPAMEQHSWARRVLPSRASVLRVGPRVAPETCLVAARRDGNLRRPSRARA
jgi:hypothetical protein